MNHGFASHDDFIESVSDGFTNHLNEKIPAEAELLSNQDGYEILIAILGKDFSLERIKAVTSPNLERFLQELNDEYEFEFAESDVLWCLAGALNQSAGDPELRNFPA